ncbi:UDP-glycosyltransferase 89A2-like [Alnus glutinosa]|uniref:UDP-glycosyltransferase 89A2-like n=1 Tax=Alnus glutinosa TaxID=3517 RepID=UPI002D765470|nr:UDP-glycosyltransferase 89A2-like [Alnus glutinosa]
MSSTSGMATHILVFPYPAQGHMLALLDLTHQLALRGLTITIFVTPKNLPILSPLLCTHPSIQTLVLPLPPHPKLPQGVENVRDIGNAGNIPIIGALRQLHDPLLRWFHSHPSPPVAIVSDFFLGWTLRLAQQLRIPRIAFFSVAAFFVSVIDHCWHNSRSVSSTPLVHFPDLPSSPSFKQEHLPSIFRFYSESNPDTAFLKDDMLANTSSWACIFNSFDELERQYLDHLGRVMGHTRIYGVGPLSLVGINDGANRSKPDSDSDTGVLAWLDGCPDGSVLYVCFGSQKLLNRQQMEALALGLEKSGTRFVWVVKAGTTQQEADGYGVVPEGFEERVGGRGVIVKGWAPQVRILSHVAVGGFVSHCGWNSVLEGIVGGTMILGWPMEADQFLNARLLVENMGVAVRVCEGAGSVPDPAHLAGLIAESMGGESAQKARARALRDKALEAVRDDGSSSRDLDALVKELAHLRPSHDA